MGKNRLGNVSTLSQLSGIKQTSEQGEKTEIVKQEDEDKKVGSKKTVMKKTIKSNSKNKLVNINIKVNKSQKDWLTDKAFEVRENNDDPVPPKERVYPQHLIGVAIDLLKLQDIDWSEIKNEQQLRELLNL
ncbi:MAG: hypothetical protein AB4063_07390 [Crocosphaera sp.]